MSSLGPPPCHRPPSGLLVRGLEVTICASSRLDLDAREGNVEPNAHPMLTHAKCELQRHRNSSSVYDCSSLRGMYAGGGRRGTARRCGRAGSPSIPVGRSHEAVTVTIPHPSIRKSPDGSDPTLLFFFALRFLFRMSGSEPSGDETRFEWYEKVRKERSRPKVGRLVDSIWQ